jgi:probable selenium-dependent hydroxylase accessory protein YqeC
LKIIDALRVANHEAVAIVGAGGKTSLMFALVEAGPKPICMTTTTKLAREECQGNFNHRLFSEFEADPAAFLEQAKINLITNSPNDSNQKWLGLSLSQADRLISFCRREGATCFIEADGARHLPLKAPAAWEPVIPDQVDLVIVVVGLSVIGKPLNAEAVFRPELFSNLTGLPIGAPIQLDHIVSLLNHPEGGLQGIPQKSRAAVVFNQADAYSFKPHELELVRLALHDHYSTAILTSLRTDQEHCEVIFRRS